MAETISDKLESAAADLRKEIKAIDNCRAELSGVWTGDNSKKLTDKLAALTEGLSNRAVGLEEVANEKMK